MICSIIIATRNRCADLVATLNALCFVQCKGCDLEIIIADNQSTDGTYKVSQEISLPNAQLRYVNSPVIGKSLALNLAVGLAKGEIIVFIDDDVRPRPDWLENLIEPLRNNSADVCVGDVMMAGHLRRSWMLPRHRMFMAETVGSPSDEEVFLTGANCAVRRQVFKSVPGFDPDLGPGTDYRFMEDSLFSQQLRAAGFRFKRIPSAVTDHHFSPARLSRGAFLARSRGEGLAIAYVDWHWAHYEIKSPNYLAWRKRIKLMLLRFSRWRECREPEGCSDWEMSLVQQIAYFSQYAKERKKPRAYARRGLLKIVTTSNHNNGVMALSTP